MAKQVYAIIEIGSNNTKTHIYEDENVIYENNVTIEFKKNYLMSQKINVSDLDKLFKVIQHAFEYTKNVHVYGCSIFRSIKEEELEAINAKLRDEFYLEIEVVSQEDEAFYTALGCYRSIPYSGTVCVFIGGGGSTELIFVHNGDVIDKRYYDFGVVDVTKKFHSLKDDIPDCSFLDVYRYVDSLIQDIPMKADVLILAGGDHLYWYNNAGYELFENTVYDCKTQKYMIPKEKSDQYDHNAFVTSLDKIRQNSDNPLWFDGSRAMKVITNLVSNKVDAKYIIPTKINMEDGIKSMLFNKLEQ